MNPGDEVPDGSTHVADESAGSVAGGWGQRWEWPWFRLVMFSGFTVFMLDDALHRDGAWRIVYWIGFAFFLIGFLVELRPVLNRWRFTQSERRGHSTQGR